MGTVRDILFRLIFVNLVDLVTAVFCRRNFFIPTEILETEKRVFRRIVQLLANRSNAERVRVFSPCVQAVCIERFGTPGVDAAKAHLVQIYTERNILVALEFPRELHVGELFRSVVLCAEFHTRIAHNHEALARFFVRERRPLHVRALTRFANFHVHDGHRVCIGRVEAHEAAAITSDVVFVRATTKVTNLFVAARHCKERTHIREIALGTIRVERVIHNDIATAINCVGHLHAGAAHIREGEVESHLSFLSGDFLDFGGHVTLFACAAPFAMATFHVEALVVIGRSTPEVRNAAVLDNRIAIENVACERTSLFIKYNLEILAFDGETVILCNLVCIKRTDVDFCGPKLTQVNAELFMANAKAGICPEFILLQAEINIQVIFGTDSRFDFRHVNRHGLLFVRTDVHLRTVNLAFMNDLAVFTNFPEGVEKIAEILVEVTALDFNLTLGRIDVLYANLAVLVFDFPHFRLNCTVGEYEAVSAEVVVVLPVAPHAAEFEVRRALVTEALVNEVPNESTESTWIAVEGIHVFLQVAHGVAHSVFVFAQHNRLVCVVVVTYRIGAKVHPAVHIGVVPVAFVMNIAGGVNFVGTLAFRGEYVTVTRFVTQRPQDNAGVVLVALHHGIHTIDSRSTPVIAILRQIVVGTMAFNVRFVNHVNTVLVAKIVHHRIVRVVRHTESVNVETLHENHIFFHAVICDCTSVIRVEFVAVNTVELHRHAVHEQTRSAIFFLDFNLSKANLVTFNLDNLARAILEHKHSRVEVRGFGRPTLRRRKREIEMHALFATVATNARKILSIRLDNFGTRSIVQGEFYSIFARFLACRIVNPNGRLQETVLVIIRKRCVNLEILNVDFGNRVNIDITHNAGKTDKVLVFEPATVAPAEHLYGNVVFTFAEILVDVKFVARESIFTVTNVIAVHPYIVSGFNAFEMQTDALAVPFFGNSKVTAVMTHRVKISRCIRGRNTVVLGPRINNVCVNRMVVAQKLPRTRNLDFIPLGHVVVVLIEIIIALARFFYMEKSPFTRKRLVPFRSMTVALHSLFDCRVRHRSHMRIQPVHAKNSRFAIPFIVGLGKQGYCGQ